MQQSKPVRVGVLGLGFMGATHVNAYQLAASSSDTPCVLTAVCDSVASRRAGHLSTAPGQLETGAGDRAFDPATVRAYESAADLFKDPEVDLISICTPTPS